MSGRSTADCSGCGTGTCSSVREGSEQADQAVSVLGGNFAREANKAVVTVGLVHEGQRLHERVLGFGQRFLDKSVTVEGAVTLEHVLQK